MHFSLFLLSRHTVLGATAGLIELLIMYPLDVVKTRMQLMTAGTSKPPGVVSSLKAIIAEGGPSRLYRGILAPMVQEPIKRSVKFTGNSMYTKVFPSEDFQTRFLCGWLAGSTECVAIAPFEVVKIRMQSSSRLDAYHGTGHCAQSIMQQEGPMGFLRGIETAVWRSGSWSGLYFSLIWYLKNGPLKIEKEHEAPKSKIMMRNFTCGLIGGTVGTIVNNPFDVIVSRMRDVVPGEVSPYRWSWQSLALVTKEEGLSALYKGFGPKVMRLGPGGGIMIMAFDVAKSFMLG